jgi:hypothetical protein
MVLIGSAARSFSPAGGKGKVLPGGGRQLQQGFDATFGPEDFRAFNAPEES